VGRGPAAAQEAAHPGRADPRRDEAVRGEGLPGDADPRDHRRGRRLRADVLPALHQQGRPGAVAAQGLGRAVRAGAGRPAAGRGPVHRGPRRVPRRAAGAGRGRRRADAVLLPVGDQAHRVHAGAARRPPAVHARAGHGRDPGAGRARGRRLPHRPAAPGAGGDDRHARVPGQPGLAGERGPQPGYHGGRVRPLRRPAHPGPGRALEVSRPPPGRRGRTRPSRRGP
jgi:hypothetical protein